jgi:hypothetical protein
MVRPSTGQSARTLIEQQADHVVEALHEVLATASSDSRPLADLQQRWPIRWRPVSRRVSAYRGGICEPGPWRADETFLGRLRDPR